MCFVSGAPGSVADIAIRYGLHISGFEPRWGKRLSFLRTRPDGQPPVQWVPALLARGQAPGAWRWGMPLLSLFASCDMLGVTSTDPLFLRSFKDAYKMSDLEPRMMTVNY